jgi:hypothetical protein
VGLLWLATCVVLLLLATLVASHAGSFSEARDAVVFYLGFGAVPALLAAVVINTLVQYAEA